MKLALDLAPAGTARVAGAPEGVDARALAQLAEKAWHTPGRRAGVLHIAQDDRRLATLAEALAFFAPELEVVRLPAWDCLPYDRVSPSVPIVAQRVEAFADLADRPEPAGPRVVLTTVNAAVQRVPPPEVFARARRDAVVGARLDRDDLQHFLVQQGYRRAHTVREPGEYAVRGDIVDVFPPAQEEPVRLDLFGNTLERIRNFDPISQCSTGEAQRVTLRPMGEAFLDPDSIQRFRRQYRALFGAVTDDDPLYAAISEGRPRTGMEHWLPLFHARMATIFDYMAGAAVTLDGEALEGRDNRIAQVADFYTARRQTGRHGSSVYKPLPPEMLYLDAAEWDRLLADRPVCHLSPFAPATEGLGEVGHVVDAGGRTGRTFTEARLDPNQDLYAAFGSFVSQLRAQGTRILLAGYSAGARDRLHSLLQEHGLEALRRADHWVSARRGDPRAVVLVVLPLEHGFACDDVVLVTEQDLLGERLARPQRGKKRTADQFISEITALNPGDLVVHVEHGIGRFEGLETITVSGAPHDCLRLVYDGGNKLFLPVENLEMLSRYGSEESGVQLDKLGGTAWQARRARVKQRVKELADRLLNIAAQRELNRTAELLAPEGAFDEFCARFPYPETDDQLSAIAATLDDMASGKPMDRLICGDVGFGKTEVALRAAFVAVMSGYQVGVVVPTTLLARQHLETFEARFQGLPVRIGQLSRLVSQKEANRVKKELAQGHLDIVIGTHALLGKNVRFDRLGLLIVDEEQHFGVRQKEKLKELATNVHVLTMTATPIPRTLQMALTGVREMSLITTPPVDRLAVRSFVVPFDPVVVREALLREHQRGGQSFYVCPRVRDIPEVADQLAHLVPELNVIQAHGQMGAEALEKAMTAFYEGQYDILLCTNIIESGLDIPATNTLIVHNAHLFGMAQLYQLRGRVGRSKVRAYAYLTTPARKQLSTSAQQRLRVLETLDTLGAGFTLASHDLDQRGAGNLLGDEQSGHVKEVGVELYQQMLEEAVANARGDQLDAEAQKGDWTPQINIGIPVMIPEDYVADLNVRLSLYRRLAELTDRQAIEGFASELVDRFGSMPEAVENLLAVVGIKCLCRDAHIERVDAGPKGATITFRDNTFAAPEKLVQFISKEPGTAKLRPDHKLVVKRDWADPQRRLPGLRKLIGALAEMVESNRTPETDQVASA